MIRAALALFVAIGAVAEGTRTPSALRSVSESREIRSGSVVAVSSTDGRLRLRVRFDDSPEARDVLLVAPSVPSRLRPRVTPAWSGSCDFSPANRVRVSEFDGLALTVEILGAPGRGPAARSGARLCFQRLYFDLGRERRAGAGSDVSRALGMALRVVAAYRTELVCWIHGPAAEVLAGYTSPGPLVAASRRDGDHALEESVGRISALRTRLGDSEILVRAAPVRYSSPLDEPVGGGWPYFVLAIYQSGSRGLKTLLELQAAAHPGTAADAPDLARR